MKGTGGEQTEAPILFVHGAWHGAWCWAKYFMPYFTSRGYDTHAITFRKHTSPGRVKGINSVSLDDYVEDLVKAVDQLDRLPIIIGHSMGGLVLQKYLAKNRCSKAIFLASAPPSGIFRTTLYLLMNTSYAIKGTLLMDLFIMVETEEKIKWAFMSDDALEEDIRLLFDNLCSESYMAFLNMLVPRVRSSPYHHIPKLALGAANDRLFTEEENKKIAKKFGADAFTLPNIAHNMMMDTNWENTAVYIKDWIEQN